MCQAMCRESSGATMTCASVYCHLPALRLPQPAPILELDGWQLVTLSGDEWFELEDPHCREWVARVDAERPVFLKYAEEFNGDLTSVAQTRIEAGKRVAGSIAIVVLLRDQILLPSVENSCVSMAKS